MSTLIRPTMYALLGAIEEDLRNLVSDTLSHYPITTTLTPALIAKATERAARDREKISHDFSIDEVVIWLDFGDMLETIKRHKREFLTDIVEAIHKFRIDRLLSIRNRVAHQRPLESDDFIVLHEAAERLQSLKSFKEVQRILDALSTDPNLLYQTDFPRYDEPSTKLHNLPLPEYDDTGFMGRSSEAQSVRKAIVGPYPVIAIVGEGGLGKTALAVKVAYDLLDDASSAFEAIIFSSSKTTQLTGKDFSEIKGAIDSSLGLFQNVAENLGDSEGDAVGHVLNYLDELRILLIIDNLETILDERITEFLRSIPASGSKLLLTSRISVEPSFSIRLSPMQAKESVDLLRAQAKIARVTSLSHATSDVLENYCRRLKYNPGFIKWFVANVQSGKSPDSVLINTESFLSYSMSNVYNFLDRNAQKLLRLMITSQINHSLPELAFLSNLNDSETVDALRQLTQTPMLHMRSVPNQASTYELSKLTRPYLAKVVKVSPEEQKNFRRQLEKLRSIKEQYDSARSKSRYAIDYIQVRTEADKVIAKMLQDALRLCQSQRFEDALSLVQKAKGFDPSYFEVHRVGAIINARVGNIVEATQLYETAIEFEPTNGILRYWYGAYLLIQIEDIASAYENLDLALKLDPLSLEVRVEFSRSCLYRKDFGKVRETLEHSIDELKNCRDKKTVRKFYDILLQSYTREAEFELDENHDAFAAADCFSRAHACYRSINRAYCDSRMLKNLAKSSRVFVRCCKLLDAMPDSSMAGDLTEIQNWFRQLGEVYGNAQRQNAAIPYSDTFVEMKKKNNFVGRIKRLEKTYGFIVTDEGVDYFFHKSACVNWSKIIIGSTVVFEIGERDGKTLAVSVVTSQSS